MILLHVAVLRCSLCKAVKMHVILFFNKTRTREGEGRQGGEGRRGEERGGEGRGSLIPRPSHEKRRRVWEMGLYVYVAEEFVARNYMQPQSGHV